MSERAAREPRLPPAMRPLLVSGLPAQSPTIRIPRLLQPPETAEELQRRINVGGAQCDSPTCHAPREAGRNLKKCSRCKMAFYCGPQVGDLVPMYRSSWRLAPAPPRCATVHICLCNHIRQPHKHASRPSRAPPPPQTHTPRSARRAIGMQVIRVPAAKRARSRLATG